MEPTTEAASSGSAQESIAVITAEGDGRLSVSEAARTLAQARKPREPQPPEEATVPLADPEPSDAPVGNIEPADLSAEAERSEAKAGAETGLPSIEPPGSWSKEDKELFATLPRETQERLAVRERTRETDLGRSQQELTEARQKYENALPELLRTFEHEQAGEFADLKTVADLERMAREDMPRYLRWDLHQKRVAALTQRLLAAEERKTAERRRQFDEFITREDELFREKVPEAADADKAVKLQNAAMAVLKDVGFAESELVQAWTGAKDWSLRDHRVQLVIRDATLWRDAQRKAKAAAAKPLPPVQRPGVSQARGAALDAQIQDLGKQLDNASGVNALRTAAKLVAAKRAAR
jgi:hypothetical protein